MSNVTGIVILALCITGIVVYHMYLNDKEEKRRYEAIMKHIDQMRDPPRLRPSDEAFLEEITADL
jgi:hypothetical protein